MMLLAKMMMCAIALQVESARGVSAGYTVQIDPIPQTVLLGSSMPVTFVIGNQSDRPLPLDLDQWSRPLPLMTILDSAGKPVSGAPFLDTGRKPPPAGSQYAIRPNERIRFRYDLTMLFSLSRAKAGKYTLSFSTEQGRVASADFVLVAHRTLEKRQLAGSYRDPVLGAPLPTALDASAVVSVVQSEGQADGRTYLLIDQIVTEKQARAGLPSFSTPISLRSTIQEAEMDCYGQVWVLLKSDGKSSLLLWRTHDLAWSVLIPDTDATIDLNVTKARTYVADQKAVIAGRRDQEKFTTFSVASYSVGAAHQAGDSGRP